MCTTVPLLVKTRHFTLIIQTKILVAVHEAKELKFNRTVKQFYNRRC